MTVKEAYVIFFGPTDKLVDETTIKGMITENDLKSRYRAMQKKFHYDVKKDRKLQEKYNAISTDINVAREILSGCLKNEYYSNPYSDTESVYHKYLEKEKEEQARLEKERIKLKKEYEPKLKRACNIAKYNTIMKIIDVNNSYSRLIKYQLSLEEQYLLCQEYNQKFKELFEKLKSIDSTYNSVISLLKSKKNISENELNYYLRELSEEDYSKLSEPEYYKKISIWLVENQEQIIEDIRKKYSEINNLKPKIIKRMTKAKNLYSYIQKVKKYRALESVIRLLQERHSLKEKVEIILEYKDYSQEIERQIRECSIKYDDSMSILDSQTTKELTKERIVALEKEIEEMITREYIDELNNTELYNNRYQDYQNESISVAKNKNKYTKLVNDIKEQLIRKINANISLLQSIEGFTKKDDNRRRNKTKVDKSMSEGSLLKIYQDTNKKVYLAQIEAIKTYYIHILSHYTNKEDLGNIPRDVYELYQEFLNNINNPNTISKCYNRFLEIYQECNNIRNYYNESLAIVSISNLIDRVEEVKRMGDSFNISLPEHIIQQYNKRYEIKDIVILYDLYVKINEILESKYSEELISGNRSRH